MSTQVTPPVPAPPSLLAELFAILQIGLSAASVVVPGAAGADLLLANAIAQIASRAVTAYQANVGQPLDLNNIPPEDPIA